MKDNETVSVVIPVYNVELYIQNCLQSVINQTYENIELILVDDGSTDDSMFIAESVLFDTNLAYQIVRQKNKGVSAARNAGFRSAGGSWIVFLDADDIIVADFVESLVNSVDHRSANYFNCVTFTNYSVINIVTADALSMHNTIFSSVKTINYSREEVQKLFLLRKIRILLPAMMVSKALLAEHEICFDEKCKYSEDIQFIWKVLGVIDEAKYVCRSMYYYVLHENSTMTASNTQKMLTGYYGINRLYDSMLFNGHYINMVMQQLKARWVFSALHSGAKMLSYQSFMIVAGKMDFPGLVNKLRGFGDIRLSLPCIVWRISKRGCYEVMRKF